MNTPSTRENSLRVAVLMCGIDIALTGYAAFSSNSVTILGSLFKELADFIAMLSAFATFRAVRREPNERFAYGVGKLENLVSVGTSILMFACGFGILYQAIAAIQDPRLTEGTLPGIVLFSGYALIGFWLWHRNLRAVRQQSSAILMSQAHLWFSKAIYDGLMALALILAYASSGTALWLSRAHLEPHSTPAATLRLATAPSTKYSATSVKSVVVRRTVRNMGMLTSLMP